MASMSGPGHISPVCAIGEEDEFMTYYKQFRPEYGSDTTNLMGTSLRFRPLIRGISTYQPWEEKTNSFSNSKPMSAGRKIPWYQSLKRKAAYAKPKTGYQVKTNQNLQENNNSISIRDIHGTAPA